MNRLVRSGRRVENAVRSASCVRMIEFAPKFRLSIGERFAQQVSLALVAPSSLSIGPGKGAYIN